MSDEIGSTSAYMKADAGSSTQTTPPLKGWRYWDGSKWNDDPEMECGKPSLPCMAVTVELAGKSLRWQIKTVGFVSGEANDTKGDCAGRYVVVDGWWKRGRQVRI